MQGNSFTYPLAFCLRIYSETATQQNTAKPIELNIMRLKLDVTSAGHKSFFLSNK